MEDSINLKKRILRMREENNTDNVIINPKTFNIKDSVQEKLIKENVLFTKLNASINNVHKNINIKSNTDNDFVSIENPKKIIEYNYNEQFKLLANKFNEAVEVILELNDRVKNLENIVYSKEDITLKINQNKNNYKIKLGLSLALIFSVLSSLLFLPADLDLTNIFKVDVWFFFNPIIRMVFYISAFCSVGTYIYLIHFNRFLEIKHKSYCFFLIKRSSIIGSAIAFLSFL